MTDEDSGGGHIAARGEGRKLFIGTLKVSAQQSGGSLEVIVLGSPPAGLAGPAEPPPHIQCDELFYIVKGSLQLSLGESRVRG